jgi:hypothetical protein
MGVRLFYVYVDQPRRTVICASAVTVLYPLIICIAPCDTNRDAHLEPVAQTAAVKPDG